MRDFDLIKVVVLDGGDVLGGEEGEGRKLGEWRG